MNKAIAGLLLFVLLSGAATALNQRQDFPIELTPKVNGALQPGGVFNYTFVFASGTGCDNLYTTKATVQIDAYGRGFADLNISELNQTPNYLCEYRDGSLRYIHTLFPTMFEKKTNDTEILSLGYNHTTDILSQVNNTLQNYALNSSLSQYVTNATGDLRWINLNASICYTNGTGCQQNAGNASWNQSLANTLYYLRTDGQLDNQTWNFTTYWNNASNTFQTKGTYLTNESLWQGNSSLVYYASNPLGFYNSSTIPSYIATGNDAQLGHLGIGGASVTPYAIIAISGPVTGLSTRGVSIGGAYAPSTGYNAYQLDLGSVSIDKGTGTHPLFARIYVTNLTDSVSSSGGSFTNSASLYIRGATSISTNGDYAIWSNSGQNRFDGPVSIGTSQSMNALDVNGSANVTGTIYEGNTALGSKYLSITAQAADSAELGGQPPSYYYAASNPNSYISSYTETDPLWQGNSSLVYYASNPLGFYNSSTIPPYALQTYVSSLGNFSANNASIWVNASNQETEIQARATTVYVQSMGNWSADKQNYVNATVGDARYLGISAKAADSDKLDGQQGTYYLNLTGFDYRNITNPPWLLSGGKAADATLFQGQASTYYLNTSGNNYVRTEADPLWTGNSTKVLYNAGFNAANLTSGTVPAARLTGNYTINITGAATDLAANASGCKTICGATACVSVC